MKFKTLLTVLGVSLITTTTINAQEHGTKSPWTVGLKGGINLFEHDGLAASLVLGGTVDYDLKNRFFLRSGLELSVKGAYSDGIHYSSRTPNNEGGYKHQYSGMRTERTSLMFQMPVTLGYRLPVSNKVNFTFNAGVFAGIGIFSTGDYHKWDYEYTIDKNGEYINWIDNSKYGNLDGGGNFDFGLMGSFGVEYRSFSYNLGYEHGLIDQGSKTYKNMGGDAIKYRAVSLSATYRF